jgi:hypothetical protein
MTDQRDPTPDDGMLNVAARYDFDLNVLRHMTADEVRACVEERLAATRDYINDLLGKAGCLRPSVVRGRKVG